MWGTHVHGRDYKIIKSRYWAISPWIAEAGVVERATVTGRNGT
jgi:hypothetical protein